MSPIELKRLKADAQRYRWLRDNPRKAYDKISPYDAPCVINPKKSVLYAVVSYEGNALDRAVDDDILQDMTQHIF